MTRKILFLAYYFPPLGGGGAIRPVKFIKYLWQSNWHPIVITSRTENYYALDSTGFNDLPNSLIVQRMPEFNLIPVYEWLYKFRLDGLAHFLRRHESRFLLPDRQMGWFRSALKAGLDICKEENIDLIFSTAPPYTCHLIARSLKHRTTLPWIADFRDEWSDYGFIRWGGIARFFQKKMEKQVLQVADKITTTTSWISQNFQEKIKAAQNKIYTITNGFDPEDFTNLPIDSFNNKKLVLTHAGSFYGQRTPREFLQALNSLIRSNLIGKNEIEINFLGPKPSIKGLSDFNLQLSSIKFWGYRSHRQALQQLSQSTALILIQSEEGYRCIPGKTYEYLALGKPILAIVPEFSAVKKLLKEKDGIYFADINNIETIRQTLYRLYRDWKRGLLKLKIQHRGLENFSYPRLVERLINLFNEVCEDDKPQRNVARVIRGV